MCIVNTPERCVELLREVADIIEKYTRLAPEPWGGNLWFESFEKEGCDEKIIDAVNDLLGIVGVSSTEGGLLRAVNFDWDAFFHSVVMPPSTVKEQK